MSVNGNYAGGLERPLPTRITTTSLADAYESDASGVVIASIALANETASPVDVELYYFDGATDFLVWRDEVLGSSSIQVKDIPLRLYPDDKVKIKAATANAITVTPIVIRNHPNEQSSIQS